MERVLTLPMLRVFSSKGQERKYFSKRSKPCHVGIHWIALTEYSQVKSTNVPGFQSFSGFLHHFVSTKLATSNITIVEPGSSLNEYGYLSRICVWMIPKVMLQQTYTCVRAWHWKD